MQLTHYWTYYFIITVAVVQSLSRIQLFESP